MARATTSLPVPLSPRPFLLSTSDAADEADSVDLGGRRNRKKKKQHAATTHDDVVVDLSHTRF